jgi:hypothetical protein
MADKDIKNEIRYWYKKIMNAPNPWQQDANAAVLDEMNE